MNAELIEMVDVYHHVPILLDNIYNYNSPVILPQNNNRPLSENSNSFSSHQNHVMYHINANHDSAENIHSGHKSNKISDMYSERNLSPKLFGELDDDHNYLNMHVQSSIISDVWQYPESTNHMHSRSIHWRILNCGTILELRLINFIQTQDFLVPQSHQQDFNSINETSSIISIVFPHKLEGKVQLHNVTNKDDTTEYNSIPLSETLVIFALSENGIIYRISLNNINSFNLAKYLAIKSETYKIKNKSPIENQNDKRIFSNPAKITSSRSISSDTHSKSHFLKQIESFDSTSLMVYWLDGLVVLVSGFGKVGFDSQNRISESIFYLIDEPQSSFVSQLYKKFDSSISNTIEAIKNVNISSGVNYSQSDNLVIGLELNRTLWVWKPHLGKIKIEIKLPTTDQNLSLSPSPDNKSFIRLIPYQLDSSNYITVSKDIINIIVYVNDSDGGYFAIVELIIDNENFGESSLTISSIKKSSEFFPIAPRVSRLIDFKILQNSSSNSNNSLSWKIFSLWQTSGSEKVMYGYLQSNDINKHLNKDPEPEPRVIWGLKSSIGEKWISDYPLPESLQPLPTSGELEILQEWLLSKKNDPNSSSYFGIDQSVDLELGKGLKEKVTKKVLDSFLSYVLNPLRFSSSIVQYALHIYINKSIGTSSTFDKNIFSLPLRNQLTNIIGFNIPYIDGNQSHDEPSLARIYDYSNQLYTEWMWFLSICSQIQQSHNSGNSLFINKSTSLVGICRSLSIDILQFSGDLEWILENSECPRSFSYSERLGSKKNSVSLSFTSHFASSTITRTPQNLLDNSRYNIVKSTQKTNILILSQAIKNVGSRLSLLSRAQLIHDFELRFIGGVYLDIESELGALFSDLYSSNPEEFAAILSESLKLILQIEDFSETVKSLIGLIMNTDTPSDLTDSFYGSNYQNNDNISDGIYTQKYYKVSIAIVSSKIAILFKNRYSLVCELLIFFSALSFIVDDFSCDRPTLGNKIKSPNPGIEIEKGFSVSYKQIYKLIDHECKSLLFSNLVEAFRLYTFLTNYTNCVTFGNSSSSKSYFAEMSKNLKSKYNTNVNHSYDSMDIDSEYNNKLENNRKSGPDPYPLLLLKISDYLPILSSSNWIRMPSTFSESTINNSFNYATNLFNNLIFNSEESYHTDSTLNHITAPINQNRLISFDDSISNFVSMCIVEYIDHEQILNLMKYLPTVFQVSFLCGVVNTELGRFQTAADCFASAASAIFSVGNKELLPTKPTHVDLKLSHLSSKAEVWLESIGFERTDIVGYYLQVAKIFEKSKAHELSSEFYTLAVRNSSFNGAGVFESNLGPIYVKIFHSAIESKQIEKAYSSIINNPDLDLQLECLRLFVNFCLDESKIEYCRLLIKFPFPGLLGEVEKCLQFKARNSKLNTTNLFTTPNQSDRDLGKISQLNYYYILFSFYMNWNNFYEASSIMYQYALRLSKHCSLDNYTKNLQELSPAATDRYLELQLQALLLSIQAMEVTNESERMILIRGAAKKQIKNNSSSTKKKRKYTESFSNFNMIPEKLLGSEVTSIVYLQDIRNQYELVKANKKILSYVKSEGKLIFDRLSFINDMYEVFNLLVDLDFVSYAIEFSSKVMLDFKAVVSKLTKMGKKTPSKNHCYMYQNETSIKLSPNPFYSGTAINRDLDYGYLREALEFFEQSLRKSSESGLNSERNVKAKSCEYLLTLAIEIFNFYRENNSLNVDFVNQDANQEHEPILVEIPSSPILPTWLTERLFKADSVVDLIRVCYNSNAILEGSIYMQKYIQDKAIDLQLSTEIQKHTNAIYLPYGLIDEGRSKLKNIIDQLVINLQELEKSENYPESDSGIDLSFGNNKDHKPMGGDSDNIGKQSDKLQPKTRLQASYIYYINSFQGVSKNIDEWLAKYLHYVKRETKEILSETEN
ncbi:Nuclear pore complex protein [Smittium culicis]|uniref:Nuclear pore complex protein n=1 Tax=Smittium culicis TaxID=133412 RepID=A0A1R1Y2P8_9FUNG|nr:Nuclear pore complex protein [Smittium culicis]